MNEIERLFARTGTGAAFARGYLSYVQQVLSVIDADAVARFIDILLSARDRDAQIFFVGNGGSAATASHFANDIGYGSRSWIRPFRASSLCDNAAVVTAIANDLGYEEVFVTQLKTAMRRGDVVVAISVSGNSTNVLRGLEYANAHGGVTVGLTGFAGGRVKEIAQFNVHVPTNAGEYGPAEDGHMVIDHLIGAFLMHACRAGSGENP
jgi:D-sedoheptulose 7-phosphate isomerase